MGSFWKGFFSIFGWSIGTRGPNIQRVLDDSKRREKWYHRGEWWEHPIYQNTFKDRDNEK